MYLCCAESWFRYSCVSRFKIAFQHNKGTLIYENINNQNSPIDLVFILKLLCQILSTFSFFPVLLLFFCRLLLTTQESHSKNKRKQLHPSWILNLPIIVIPVELFESLFGLEAIFNISHPLIHQMFEDFSTPVHRQSIFQRAKDHAFRNSK